MEEMIAFCGLACHECPTLLATKADDDEKRAAVARKWSELFKADIKPEMINCDGCLTVEGSLFGYCSMCETRKCGMERGVDNCGYCDEYPCDKLDFIFNAAPGAKKRLDDIHSKR